MNKKVLSVALFGALMAFSVGTFTSCNDYDDDIDGLTGRVDALEKTISELNTKFGSLAYVKSVEFKDGKMVVTDQEGKSSTFTIPKGVDTNTTYTLEASIKGNVVVITLTDDKGNKQTKEVTLPEGQKVEAFDPSKLVVGADGTVTYNGDKTGVVIPTTTTDVKIVEVKDNGATIGWAITSGGITTNLKITDVLPLTSFSFEPDLLYGGVPSMKALSVVYKPWNIKTNCDKPIATGEVWNKTTKDAFISPVIAGTYYLNPSTVTIDQIEKVEVLSNDLEYKTRAAKSKPEVESYEVKNGVLTVYFSANTGEIKDLNSDSQITGLKVKLTTKAGNEITDQDYRGIYTSQYKNLVLADKGKKIAKVTNHHLYGTATGLAKEAIDADADYKVEYNSSTGLDLKPLVITCFDDLTGSTDKEDETLSASELERLGLRYEFHLCAYLEGTNQTNQSDFARIENGVLFPKLYSETATPYAAVGRKPLVRVQLLAEDGAVVSTGWIKVEIVKGITPAITVPFDFGSFTNQCEDKDFTLTVEQMNVKIYNALGLNRTEFNALYTIKQVNNLVGVNNYGNGNGVVSLKQDNTNPTVTDLLSWNVTQADMATALALDKGILTTTVVYEPIDGTTRENVTVTFTVKVAPIAGVSINNKISEYWDPAFEYIRLNVAVPKTVGDDNSANCTFVVDLDNVWVGNKPNIKGVKNYHYIFADKNLEGANKEKHGVSGKVYTLSLENENLELYARTSGVKELVVSIDKTSGVVTYAETSTAKDLLNIAGHSSVPNGGFFAWINVKATIGESCELELPINNGLFKAYFFRPIDVTGGEGKFIDAVDGGSKLNMLDLMSFNDWRDYEFDTKKNQNYFGFYGITGITIDIPNITTDLNGNDINSKLLTDVTTQLVITQSNTGSGLTPEFGTVTYMNNGTAVGAFNLRLPVTVTYKWGEVKAYVIVPVAKTEGN